MKKIVFLTATLLVCFFYGCGTSYTQALTKNDASDLLAKYYHVTNQDIQITNFLGNQDQYTANYKVKLNNQWTPEGQGFYMAQLKKDNSGHYQVDVPKF